MRNVVIHLVVSIIIILVIGGFGNLLGKAIEESQKYEHIEKILTEANLDPLIKNNIGRNFILKYKELFITSGYSHYQLGMISGKIETIEIYSDETILITTNIKHIGKNKYKFIDLRFIKSKWKIETDKESCILDAISFEQ